jgi:ABC-type branched-subunit amino acid transport system ATPase component
MYSLKCHSLTVAFGGNIALDDLTIEIPPGCIFAIIGPNGAGKTTLVNVISGHVKPSHGECEMGGVVLSRLPPYQIARHGIRRTFQVPRLARRLDALENLLLAFPNQPAERLVWALVGSSQQENRNRQAALQILDEIGIAPDGKLVGTMSFGEQKLLSVGCCLASDAQVIILDEPFAGVDIEVRTRILAAMRDQHAIGKTLVLIEHDMSVVREISDQVAVMNKGRLVCQGPTAEVMASSEVVDVFAGR